MDIVITTTDPSEEKEALRRAMSGAEATIYAIPQMPTHIGPANRKSKHRNAKMTKARKRRSK